MSRGYFKAIFCHVKQMVFQPFSTVGIITPIEKNLNFLNLWKREILYLSFPQFTSPLATFISAFYSKREDLNKSLYTDLFLFRLKVERKDELDYN